MRQEYTQAALDKKTLSQTNVKYIVTIKIIVCPLHICHGMLLLLYTHIYNMQQTHTIITKRIDGRREGRIVWMDKERKSRKCNWIFLVMKTSSKFSLYTSFSF